MANIMYLAAVAHTCRQLADQAREPETAFNLFELAKIYDRQIERATTPAAKPKVRLVPIG